MRWHKEGKCDSEDPDIISHPTDSEAWEALDPFDPDFVRDPMSVCFACRWMVSNLTARPIVCSLAGQQAQQMSETRFCLPCPYHPRS
jgi:hypothetical protein